jgi:micrococcal nuclease
MYTYMAEVVRILDGDTIEVIIDLGFKVYWKTKIRLAGIDAPEKDTPAGQVAIDALRFMIASSKVRIVTEKDKQEKFGRYLATVYPFAGNGEGVSVNELMVIGGYAREYEGGKR